MTTHYTDYHRAGHRPATFHGRFRRYGATLRSWLSDIAIGTVVFAGFLAFAALPIALRFWLAMPELTRFSQ